MIVLNPVQVLWVAVRVLFQVGLHSHVYKLTVFHFVWLPLLKDHCHTLANLEMYFPEVPRMDFSIHHLSFLKELYGNKISLLS